MAGSREIDRQLPTAVAVSARAAGVITKQASSTAMRRKASRKGDRLIEFVRDRVVIFLFMFFGEGVNCLAFRDFSSLRTHFRGPLIVIASTSILGSAL